MDGSIYRFEALHCMSSKGNTPPFTHTRITTL